MDILNRDLMCREDRMHTYPCQAINRYKIQKREWIEKKIEWISYKISFPSLTIM